MHITRVYSLRTHVFFAARCITSLLIFFYARCILFFTAAHLLESSVLCFTLQYCEVAQQWKVRADRGQNGEYKKGKAERTKRERGGSAR